MLEMLSPPQVGSPITRTLSMLKRGDSGLMAQLQYLVSSCITNSLRRVTNSRRHWIRATFLVVVLGIEKTSIISPFSDENFLVPADFRYGIIFACVFGDFRVY